MYCLVSFDALHGASGVYAKKIFVEELGAQESYLTNCNPLVRSLFIQIQCEALASQCCTDSLRL
jgi:phosphoglucomutase